MLLGVMVQMQICLHWCRISTAIVLVITSNLGLADAPSNVWISKSESALTKASVMNVSQVLTIDRSLLIDRVKALAQVAMSKVNDGLRLVLTV